MLFVFLAAGLLAASAQASERRMALVIGNSAYKAAPLKNPVNDARDMAAALKGLGFEVSLLADATHKQMESAAREFGLKLRQGGVGLFYYAGHGIQVAGENYLVPVDALIQTESDVKFGCLNAGLVLGKMEDAGNGLNVIILDACRNNPFARSFRSAEMGLAKMDAPTGSIIAYATAPGSVAADGPGKNGVYTEHLLRNMRTPGLPITDLFMRVRMGVVAATGKKQVPWEASSLTGYFYFNGAGQPGHAPPVPVASAPAAPAPAAQAKLDPRAERKRLAEEAERLKREKQELAQYQALQAEKERLEAERRKLQEAKLLALGSRPTQPPAPAQAAPQANAHAAQFAQLARAGLPDARAYFEQAVQTRPDDANARAGLAIALVFSGREADAKYHVQRLNESAAQTPGVRLARGLMLGLEGSQEAGYQVNRALEDGADRALVLLCQTLAAVMKSEYDKGQRLMADYAALVLESERGEYARGLAKRTDPLSAMTGTFTWTAAKGQWGKEASMTLTLTADNGTLSGSGTMIHQATTMTSALSEVEVCGTTMSFVFMAKYLLFIGEQYRFTCALTKDFGIIAVVKAEVMRMGSYTEMPHWSNSRLVRQSAPQP
ncbi:MAG: caspase family protein [Humidesulfovibrio sp.]